MGNKNDIIYDANDTSKKIGKIVKKLDKGKVDAAFVKITNSNYKVSRQVYYKDSKGNKGGPTITDDVYTYLADGAIGMTVYKAGATTYLTKGKLVSDSFSYVYDNVNYKDFYGCSYNSYNGDSGGVVYIYDEEGYQYIGVHSARINGTRVATKWENIDEKWNIYFE